MSRFVLITPSPDFTERMRAAVEGALPGGVHTVPTAELPEQPEQIFDLLGGVRPAVVVLGPGVPLDGALRLATVFDVRFPDVSILLTAEADAELMLQAMRAGIRDVVSANVEPDQLRVVLQRSVQTSEGRRRESSVPAPAKDHRGRVIGVFSPKGGVGKTTLATNIAVGLGKVSPMNVVIIDLDLQFGDVASGLDLDPEHTVTDAVSRAAAQDSLVLKAFLTLHPAGIYALCAPRDPVEADHITPEQVALLVRQLADQFEYVIVDTAPGLGECTLSALEECTDGVWVTGMDVPGVRGLRSSLDVLGRLGLLPETRHLVINMADAKADLSVRDVEATVGVPVDVSVPRSRWVSYSTNRGVPVLQSSRRDKATTALSYVVDRFTPDGTAKARRRLHRRVVVS
ncbi:AAA family ATPase [Sinomonas atrocyanea]|jgi:pilus assembly protein CpaE|uniref:AAA family ATPase n=1 Tax=Sinomonas atrocyanea TaxID=37927 RepID=UPI00285B55E0|nr:AAA family ATPase [Sinomonas atrocyanea]MDR6620923.1 pilus assembly protein CpaE [Sinomonas atrocyanea]